jgi:phosphoribulokinase
MPTDRIVAFYSGGADDRGRTLDAILAWPDDRLESVHDYIQWVFPTAVLSGVNPFAPLVTSDTTAAFASSPTLTDGLRRALDRMLAFYGLRREQGATGEVLIAMDEARFLERSRNWLRPGNHNHLRLTRIMQSLWILDLRAEAKALQRCLTSDVYEGPGRQRITRETYEFWVDAV